MTELDFDELDKAVTNIMSGIDTSKRKEGFDEPEDKVIEIPSNTDLLPAGSANSMQPVTNSSDFSQTTPTLSEANATPKSEPTTTAPLAIKRRGQFMDVMHPSSDMKTMVAPRREGIVLQPSAQYETPSATAEDSETTDSSDFVDSSPHESVSVPSEIEPSSDTATTEVPSGTENVPSWSDPVETLQKSEAPLEVDSDDVTDPLSDDIVAVPEEVVQEIANPESEQPISSPFLADAKVEKRPLGAATPFPESVATPDTTVATSEIPPRDNLPEELKNEVMELESSSTVGTATMGGQTASKPAISGSIPQQYTEQPSSNTVSNSAIYDTSTHHQPLDGGVKSASPMKWIILALVLLIVGALAGAAYFYLQTQ